MTRTYINQNVSMSIYQMLEWYLGEKRVYKFWSQINSWRNVLFERCKMRVGKLHICMHVVDKNIYLLMSIIFDACLRYWTARSSQLNGTKHTISALLSSIPVIRSLYYKHNKGTTHCTHSYFSYSTVVIATVNIVWRTRWRQLCLKKQQ